MNIMHHTRRNHKVHIAPTDDNHLVDINATSDEKRKSDNHNDTPRGKPPRRHRHQDSPTKSKTCDGSSPEKDKQSPPTTPRGKNFRRNSHRRHHNNHGRQRNKQNKQHHPAVELPNESLFVALDCEMVGIGPDGGHTSSVARVTLIDWDGSILFDEYIQQTQPVTDYRTFVSGITPQQLSDATMTLQECRIQLMELLDSHILVGHALKNDLRALNIHHPWYLTRDTAKYEPFMQVRFDDGILWPRKLKDLCHEKLHKDIQIQGESHSPYEDALAALDLYKAVRPKWEKVIQYKITKTNQIQQRQQEQEKHHHQEEEDTEEEEEEIVAPTPAPQ